MFIYSHNENSVGARDLSREMKVKRIKHEKSAFIGSKDKVVINWGSQNIPDEVKKCVVLNKPEKVALASNKLKFFNEVNKVPEDQRPRIPFFSTDKEFVKKEVVEKKKTFVARTVLNGSGGEGIEFITFDDKNSWKDAPLYVEYVKKKDEYRVHFVKNELIDWQRKALRPGIPTETANWKIRNLQNGFIYVRNDANGNRFELPADVRKQAELVVNMGLLDFGAIDLIYNEGSKKAYVLEVNTAPGLHGTTVTSYATAFSKNWS